MFNVSINRCPIFKVVKHIIVFIFFVYRIRITNLGLFKRYINVPNEESAVEMMLIEKYGITLRRLEDSADIELVRQWRNSKEVNQFMFFRDHITPEMQRSWFERINNDQNYYFIIELKGNKIGLSNLKDISYEDKHAEGGIFIADEIYREGTAAVQTSFALADFAFDELGLTHVYASILPDNQAAISFNKGLGYKLKDAEKNLYVLTKEDYYIVKNKFIKILSKF